MRVEPSEKYVNRVAIRERNARKITRVLALIMVIATTFIFFFKLLFF